MSLFRDTGKIKDQTLRRTLSVGAPDLINTYTFVPLYRRHILDNRETRLIIRTYHSGELYRMLETRAIDIGYVYSRRRYQDILTRPLYQDRMVVLCHRDSRYWQGIRPEQLPAEQEIFLRWNADYEIWHDRYWPTGKSLMVVGTGDEIPLYLDMPDRWAIAPASIYQLYSGNGNLACFDLDDAPPPLTCYEITHRYPKPSLETLIQVFQAEVEAYINESGAVQSVP